MKTQIHKIPIKLHADPKRVITLPSIYPGLERVKRMYDRVANYTADETKSILKDIRLKFGSRHKDLNDIFEEHYLFFKEEYASFPELDDDKKILLGAVLTKEYSIQSAALFNPSMVPHPDQTGLEESEKRFIISLRAVGEGHISSIEFRSGVVDDKGVLKLDDCSPYALRGKITPLDEENDYKLEFAEDSDISERVLFPQTELESMGMEDLRLVHFSDGNEDFYLGTYTAYNGRKIRSQLLKTKDFRTFEVRTLNGAAIQDKGMAIFPEKVNGEYVISARQGGENMSIMFSDELMTWTDFYPLMEPAFPFEISQIGNCGSPVRTEDGWLILTHGVGPFRQYTISTALLDINDPSKVISRLDRPLIWPEGEEREGYVPNVVYSCGCMLHKELLYIPYAMSDSVSGFACLNLNELLEELNDCKA